MIPVEITRLIPQREPILMVDRLERVEGDSAGTLFLIRDDNFFLEGKRLAEVGIVEHIAQSASALFGFVLRKFGVCWPAPVPAAGQCAAGPGAGCGRRFAGLPPEFHRQPCSPVPGAWSSPHV